MTGDASGRKSSLGNTEAGTEGSHRPAGIAPNSSAQVATSTADDALGHWPESVVMPTYDSAIAASASATAGSNWVPAQARSSPRACSSGIAFR